MIYSILFICLNLNYSNVTEVNKFNISISINKFICLSPRTSACARPRGEKNEKEFTKYIKQFFVGLLEGDGTITVDYISDRKKRIRIFIALNNLEENRFMVDLIVRYIGGRKAIERNNRYVTWYATNRIDLAKVLAIIDKYPLLSSRKLCQLDFAKGFINSTKDMSKEEFYRLRDDKYKNQKTMLDLYDKNFCLPNYFSGWLSGFIESEGHFKLVKTAKNSIKKGLRPPQLVIGQNNEKHLLKAILTHFNLGNNKISTTLNKQGVIYYKIHLAGKDFRSLLASHFNYYPLLGDKWTKYQKWVNNH